MNKLYCPRSLDLTCVALLTALLLPGTGTSVAAAQDGPAVVRASSDPVVISSDRAVFHTFGGWIIELAAGGSAVLGYAMEDGVPRPFRWTAGHGKEWLQLPAGMEDARVNEPRRISADGSTVVWVFRDHGLFHWQEGAVTVDAGTFTRVWDLSADGSVVVGNFWDHVNPDPNLYPGGYDEHQPFRWTLGAGVRNLGTPGNGIHSLWTVATTVSADGTVVAGHYHGDDFEDFWRWTEGDGMARLNVTSDYAPSWSTILSADGNVLIGVTRRDGSGERPFRWTVEEGTTLLDPPGITSFGGESLRMSSDGRTVLFSTDLGWHRWRPEEGFDVLEPPEPELSLGGRMFASADGSVIAGRAGGLFDGGAVIWDEDGNARWLKEMLVSDYDLDLEDWTLNDVQGLSHDGRTITGRAFFGSPGDPDFAIQNYVVRLDPDFHTFRWVGPSNGDPSGDFEVAEHWEAVDDPEVQRVPGPGDTVVFDLIADPGYVVTLQESRQTGTMRVEQGTLTFRQDHDEALTLRPTEFADALLIGTVPGVRGGLDLVNVALGAQGDVIVGDGTGTDGLLTLREGTYFLVAPGMFQVGHDGRGQVFVLGEPTTLHTSGIATVGHSATPTGGGSGSVTVRAAGHWEHGGDGELWVGGFNEDDFGEVTIATSGQLRTKKAVVGPLGGSGSIVVADHGSFWENEDELVVGGRAPGELLVQDGGRVQTGAARVGREAPGEIHLANEGSFRATLLRVGSELAPGALWLEAGSEAVIAEDLIIDARGGMSGADVVAAQLVVGETPGPRHLLVTNGGVLEARAGALVRIHGNLDLQGGDAGERSFLLMEDSRLEAEIILIGADEVATATGPATLHMLGGEVVASAGVIVGPEGWLGGAGTLTADPVVRLEGGYVAPALDPGGNQLGTPASSAARRDKGASAAAATLIIDGDVEQASGVIQFQVAGLEEGRSNRLVVTGDASLAGTVEVFFIDGFAPTQGDAFGFLEVGGAFSDDGMTMRLPNLLPGFEYETQFTDGTVGLTALTDGVVFSAPALTSPADGEEPVPVNPTLTWQPVEGATHYRAQLTVEAPFRHVILDEADVSGTSLELEDLAPDTEHHWRVKAFGENLESAWSAVFTFVTGIAVSVEDPVAERPSGFRLHQNYPNPFNPSTRIVYDLPEPAHVVIRVFDTLGREVAVLVDQQQAAGRYDVVFDSGALPSGLYLYRMEAGEFRQVRRMVVVK